MPDPSAAGPGDAHTAVERFLPDAIYGANDGLITTFAIVAGVVGANLSTRVIVILGLANLIADGVSMGASNVLARRSNPDPAERDGRRAVQHGLVTWGAFVIAGAVPLLAYLFPVAGPWQFDIAIALTLTTLFVIGALRALVLDVRWLRAGLEMLAIGAAAALVAYGIGALGASVTGTDA